jgi:His-Xaa-Ser system radical SAM maturase HxsC
MKSYRSQSLKIKNKIIGKATRNASIQGKMKSILLSDEESPNINRFLAVLSTKAKTDFRNNLNNRIHEIPASWLDSIEERDIILIEDGMITVLWEQDSNHNTIMVTNQCNSNCIICPQPSGVDPEDLHQDNMRMLRLIDNRTIRSIGLTGGEPTVYLNRCIEIIKECKKRFPEASISILTNGRLLSIDNALKLVSIGHRNLMFCIPIYADNSLIHDYITGCPGSFADTVNSIQNLAILKQKIELRIVVTKQNYRRLQNISEFIFRNFPFSVHIAFMGMEICGIAESNKDEVWIEPYEYIEDLCKAVRHLHQRNMNVSLYNIPLCLIPTNYWRFAADSISDWKKGYSDICEGCVVKKKCPGLFTTSQVQSKYLKTILN